VNVVEHQKKDKIQEWEVETGAIGCNDAGNPGGSFLSSSPSHCCWI